MEKKAEKQVDKAAYDFLKYSHKGRWVSYFHQLNEVFLYLPHNVLEIGIGDSVFAHYLKSNTTIKYTGVDIAADLHPDIVASADAIPVPDNSYDVVCAFEVFEHMPFEKFAANLKEMKRISKKAVIISLPHFGPSFKFLLKVPFIYEIVMAFKIPFPKKHTWNGQHYWEIGKKGYSPKKIREIIRKEFMIKKEFVPFENQYHHFFVLENKDENLH